MRQIFIIVGLLVAALAAHYGYWRYRASGELAAIDRQIAGFNAARDGAAARSVLAYGSASPGGWPLRRVWRLHDASLTQTAGMARYRLAAEQVEVSQKDGVLRLFAANGFTGESVEANGARADYAFTLTPPGSLQLRTPKAREAGGATTHPLGRLIEGQPPSPGAEPDLIYQFRATLASPVRLDVTEGGRSAAAGFEIPAAYLAAWQTIPPSLAAPVGLLFDLLEETSLTGKTQPSAKP